MKCDKCGTENKENFKYCKGCGRELSKIKGEDRPLKPRKYSKYLKNVPGFRSHRPWKMILATGIYFIIFCLLLIGLGMLIINEEVQPTVNAAMYTSQIGNNTPINDEYLLMNVSMENRGDDPVTIYPEDFSLEGEGFYFSANELISPDQIEIPPRSTSTLILAFDVPSDDAPVSLEYSTLWDPTITHSDNIGEIKDIPSDGQYATYQYKYQLSTGQKRETTLKVEYEDVNSTHIQESYDFKNTEIIITARYNWGYEYLTPAMDESRTMDKYYLKNSKGTYMSGIIFPSNIMSYIGDSITIGEEEEVGEETLVGTEIIEINGKEIECWVTEENYTDSDFKGKNYYDMTTGLLVKYEASGTITDGGGKTYDVKWILEDTNIIIPSLADTWNF